ISNEVRVRVEGSKKRLMTVRPRKAGTFLISRLETSRNDSAVSSRWVICSVFSSRIPRRCFISNRLSSRGRGNKKAATRAALYCSSCCGSLDNYHPFVFIKVSQHHFDDFAL